MFTYLSNLVWGAEEEKDATGALDASEMEHSAQEEAGEWLVINTGAEQPAEKSKSDIGSTSQESECDRESVCSDGSWVITPAPTFRVTGNNTTSDTTHPLENLLIEHPTMSVYGQVPEGGEGDSGNERNMGNEGGERRTDAREQQVARAQAEVIQLRIHNRERYQLAEQLQLPINNNRNHDTDPAAKAVKSPLRVTRKGTRRHNQNKHKTARGKQNLSIKKCSFVAGRRRC